MKGKRDHFSLQKCPHAQVYLSSDDLWEEDIVKLGRALVRAGDHENAAEIAALYGVTVRGIDMTLVMDRRLSGMQERGEQEEILQEVRRRMQSNSLPNIAKALGYLDDIDPIRESLEKLVAETVETLLSQRPPDDESSIRKSKEQRQRERNMEAVIAINSRINVVPTALLEQLAQVEIEANQMDTVQAIYDQLASNARLEAVA